jgi:mRNA-degrading endonuclease RelE of RelBE toxin-antitoxin system
MIYRRTSRFNKQYQLLPVEIKKKAQKAFQLFGENPDHPSLRIKRVKGTREVWEGRIDIQYRFTFHYEPGEGETICVFRNIDNHDECLKNP